MFCVCFGGGGGVFLMELENIVANTVLLKAREGKFWDLGSVWEIMHALVSS